jgi:anti-sigma regulatory factor (Ser/Thr protein kinase)
VNDWRHASHSETFESAALSARVARDVVRGVCAEALMPTPMVDTALLLVSEVITNAIVHGEGRPVLDIDVSPHVLRVTVTDDNPVLPRVRRDNPLLAPGGRGLHLVDTLSTRWGTDRRVPTGKSVWFELDHG